MVPGGAAVVAAAVSVLNIFSRRLPQKVKAPGQGFIPRMNDSIRAAGLRQSISPSVFFRRGA